MASGFLNSSGADLDTLFYTNNGNAGAIGYLTSSGQDLGNRYTNAATLGYNVGYKNSAGTDIGYLRGNLVAPTGTVSQAVSSIFAEAWDDGFDDGEYWNEENVAEVSAVVGSTVKVSNSQPISSITYTLQLKADKTNHGWISVNTSSTTKPTNSSLDFEITTSWKDAASWSAGTSSNCAFLWDSSYYNALYQYIGTMYCRIKAVVSNAAGSTTIYSSEYSITVTRT